MEQTAQTPAHGPLPFGAPIPTPDYFPVTWAKPEDAQAFWEQDRMHFPEPATPLMESVFFEHFYHGIQVAFDELSAPAVFVVGMFNGYPYNSPRPRSHDPAEMEMLGRRAQDAMGAILARQSERWAAFLLEVKEHLATWEAFDLPGSSNEDLLGHLEETIARGTRVWEIHFLTALPAYQAVSMFDDLYRDLFGNESAFDAYKLLQGFDNMTLQTALALWRLSRQAIDIPSVRAVLEENAASDVTAALERSSEGRSFLAGFRSYLAEYGQRAYELDLSSLSWIEDPTLPIKMLKDYAGQSERDLPGEMTALAEERERLIAEIRARLAGYPQPVVEQFEFFLKAAQEGNILSEDHSFWIDFRCQYRVRQVLVECGRRLSGAVIDRPEDVFFLTLEEVISGLSGSGQDMRKIVPRRRGTYQHFRDVHAPAVLGTMPPGPPPDDPGTRFILKFWGGPPQPPTAPDSLRGAPGSPGTAQGPARVLRSLAEAGKLQKGDVLICETTAPPWTPLFAIASAVVTDTGGVLSHCAIVAREYGIPAVVGTGAATMTIQDGQTVEVDGNTGIVRIAG